VDVNALARAVSRPGIDPRRWVALAVITELGFDAENGVFADIAYIPDGTTDTAVVGAWYAGDGFGAYAPLKVDDVVLVAIPDGDPSTGPVVICRMWSSADKPPAEAGGSGDEPTTDPVTRVEDGATFRIVAKGGASVRVELEGSGTFTVEATGGAAVEVRSETRVTINAPSVELGDTPAQGMARIGDLVSIGLPPGVPPPFPAVLVGQILSGKAGVKG
jgi:hypothetical protein